MKTGTAIVVGLIAVLVIAFGIYMVNIDVTDEGSLPEVSVEGGEMPEVDTEVGDVEVGTETRDVEVTTPTVDVVPPADN